MQDEERSKELGRSGLLALGAPLWDRKLAEACMNNAELAKVFSCKAEGSVGFIRSVFKSKVMSSGASFPKAFWTCEFKPWLCGPPGGRTEVWLGIAEPSFGSSPRTNDDTKRGSSREGLSVGGAWASWFWLDIIISCWLESKTFSSKGQSGWGDVAAFWLGMHGFASSWWRVLRSCWRSEPGRWQSSSTAVLLLLLLLLEFEPGELGAGVAKNWWGRPAGVLWAGGCSCFSRGRCSSGLKVRRSSFWLPTPFSWCSCGLTPRFLWPLVTSVEIPTVPPFTLQLLTVVTRWGSNAGTAVTVFSLATPVSTWNTWR